MLRRPLASVPRSSSRPVRRTSAGVLLGSLLALTACDSPDEFDEIESSDDVESLEAAEDLVAATTPSASTTYPLVTTRPAGCPVLGSERRWPISGGEDPQGWPIPDDPTPEEVDDTIDVIGDVYSWIIRGGDPHMHHGVDFRTDPEGTDVDAVVHAVASGFVTRICWVDDPDYSSNGCDQHPGKGNFVVVQHDDVPSGTVDPLYSVYAHLDGFDADGDGIGLTTGDCVTAGQPIAIAGATGNASKEHLHLEVHEDLTSARSPGADTSISPWTLLPERATPSIDEVETLAPAPNGDLRVKVKIEAMHSTLGRVVHARMNVKCFPMYAPPYWICLPNQVTDSRELDVRGSTMDACTPSVMGDPDSTPLCNGFLVEATDYDPGQYQTDNSADRLHEWTFSVAPLTPAAGDELFMVYDLDDQLIGMTSLQ